MLFTLSKAWLSHSKGLNESFKPNYNERACPVREYCPISQPDWLTGLVPVDQSDFPRPLFPPVWGVSDEGCISVWPFFYINISPYSKDHKTWLLFKNSVNLVFFICCFYVFVFFVCFQNIYSCISVKLKKCIQVECLGWKGWKIMSWSKKVFIKVDKSFFF